MSSMSCAAGSNVSSPLNSQFSVAQVSRTSFVDFVGLDDLDDLDDLDEDDEVSRSHLKCLSNNYTKTWDFSGSQRLYNINQTIYSVCLNMFEWRMKYVTHTHTHDIADIVKHIQITCPASIIYLQLSTSWACLGFTLCIFRQDVPSHRSVQDGVSTMRGFSMEDLAVFRLSTIWINLDSGKVWAVARCPWVHPKFCPKKVQ